MKCRLLPTGTRALTLLLTHVGADFRHRTPMAGPGGGTGDPQQGWGALGWGRALRSPCSRFWGMSDMYLLPLCCCCCSVPCTSPAHARARQVAAAAGAGPAALRSAAITSRLRKVHAASPAVPASWRLRLGLSRAGSCCQRGEKGTSWPRPPPQPWPRSPDLISLRLLHSFNTPRPDGCEPGAPGGASPARGGAGAAGGLQLRALLLPPAPPGCPRVPPSLQGAPGAGRCWCRPARG